MYFNAHLLVVISTKIVDPLTKQIVIDPVTKHPKREDKIVQTVVSVKTQNDGQHIGSYCDLVVPLNCRIQYTGANKQYLTDYPKVLFAVGDPITITANYDGYPQTTIFTGFIYDFVEGTPTTIKCTDYVYYLNQSLLDIHYSRISIIDLVKRVLQDTGVSLIKGTFNFNLVNITFRLMSPAAILEWLKKSIGLNISLMGNKLYVNIASDTLGQVIYATDRNVIGCKLQTRDAVFQKLKLKAWFIREDGTKDSFEVGDENGELREVFFYMVDRDMELYKKLAKAALFKALLHKYSGSIETLLYPECDLFWKATYTDLRYPSRNGNYTVNGINISIDEHGYHKTIRLAFLSDILN